MNSLTFGQGGADPPLQAILISKTPSNHTVAQDILFVASPEVRLLVNNFERARVGLSSLTFSQGGADPLLGLPHFDTW